MDRAALADILFALVEGHGGSADIQPHYDEDLGQVRITLQIFGVSAEGAGETIAEAFRAARDQLDQLSQILHGAAAVDGTIVTLTPYLLDCIAGGQDVRRIVALADGTARYILIRSIATPLVQNAVGIWIDPEDSPQ
jgi:hypothetical protein